MPDIRQEIDIIIEELEKYGINMNSHVNQNITNIEDTIQNVLQYMGITEERFKSWFNLNECNCTKRKAWLNSILYWYKNKKTQG